MSKLFHCTTDYLLLDKDEMDTDEDQNVSEHNDIVNIGWHIYLKDITAYAACSRDW